MSVLLAIVLAGIGTYLSRALFIVALSNQRFPPLALRCLEYVAPAVMGALIVSMLTTADGEVNLAGAELAGLLAAAFIAWRTRNHIYTIIVAMVVFWSAGLFGL